MNPDTLCVSCMEDDSGSPICPQCGAPFDIPYTNTLQLRPRTILRQQYLIGRALGHGGFGITYLAYDLALQSRLAIKEYMPSGVAGRSSGTTTVSPFSEKTKEEYEWGLERFLDEARVLKKFSSSPNIVSVDTIFRDNGTAYMVMEYLDGMTFEEFLRRRGGKVTLETAMRVMLPIMDALSVLHAEGILHRDISPDNIHLSKTGKVKLIDFGAARNALSQKSRNLSVILKEGYAPEEQYRSSGIQGPWTDVYSTAATLYHGITGIVPPPALDRHQGEDKLETPSRLGVMIPANAERALMRALAVRASDRFQSMQDFKAAVTGQPVAAPAPPVVAAAPRVVPAAPPPPQQFAPAPPNFPQPQPSAAPPPPPVYTPSAPQQNFAPPPPPQRTAPPVPPPAPPRGPSAQMPPAEVPRPPQQASKGFPKWLIPVALVCLVALAGAATIAVHYGSELFHKLTGTPAQQQAQGASGAQGGPPPQSDEDRQRQLEQQRQGQGQGQDTAQGTDQPQAQPQDQPAAQPQAQPDDQPAAAPAPVVAATPVAPAPVAAPVVATPAPAVVAPGYDAMLATAETDISNSQYDDAAAVLKRAIAANPARPQAYNSLAKVEMYFLHAPNQAFEHYRASLSRGGVASFYVYHDHGGGEFQNYCSGWLTVSRGKASFKADDTIHSFPTEPVKEAKKNRLMGKFLSAQGKSLHAFHVRLLNNHNFNFGPSSETPGPESDFIVRVIETGS